MDWGTSFVLKLNPDSYRNDNVKLKSAFRLYAAPMLSLFYRSGYAKARALAQAFNDLFNTKSNRLLL